MTLRLDKSLWKRVRLGDVIRRSREQVDPHEQGVERYVAGGHVDSDSNTIERWGDPSDGHMGSTFRYVFEPGQVLFVSARPYLRKSGVVDFAGVVADKTYVLDAVRENGLVQEFLPFVLASGPFIEYATAEATGSMNPRLLWGPLQRYEFTLPPLDEQKAIADLLWAIERHRASLVSKVVAIRLERLRAIDLVVQDALTRRQTCLADLAEIRGGIQKGKTVVGDSVEMPYLRVANVQDGWLDLTEVKTIKVSPGDAVRYCLRNGDVLMTEGGDIDQLGRGTVWRASVDPCLHQNHVFAVRANPDRALPEWLSVHTESSHGRAYFRVAAKRTSNLASVNKSQVSAFPIGDVAVAEQHAAIARIQVFDGAISASGAELECLERLRQAVSSEVFGSN